MSQAPEDQNGGLTEVSIHGLNLIVAAHLIALQAVYISWHILLPRAYHLQALKASFKAHSRGLSCFPLQLGPSILLLAYHGLGSHEKPFS